VPNATDLFFYSAAFITVVLGLAVGDMVQSAHRLFRAGRRVRWHVIPVLAILFVLLSVLTQFFTLWEFLGPSRFTFWQMVGAFTAPTLIAVAAQAVLPDDVPEDGLDLEAFYFGQRTYIHTVLFLAFLADLIYIWAGVDRHRPDYWSEVLSGVLGNALVMPLFAWMARSRSRRVHLIGLLIPLSLALLVYGDFEISVAPTP
jgi:hypothetical protein